MDKVKVYNPADESDHVKFLAAHESGQVIYEGWGWADGATFGGYFVEDNKVIFWALPADGLIYETTEAPTVILDPVEAAAQAKFDREVEAFGFSA